MSSLINSNICRYHCESDSCMSSCNSWCCCTVRQMSPCTYMRLIKNKNAIVSLFFFHSDNRAILVGIYGWWETKSICFLFYLYVLFVCLWCLMIRAYYWNNDFRPVLGLFRIYYYLWQQEKAYKVEIFSKKLMISAKISENTGIGMPESLSKCYHIRQLKMKLTRDKIQSQLIAVHK